MTASNPNHTIYINNLNEKVKIPELKQALMAMFSQFGEILEIIAKKTLACKGQAWIAFKDMSSAAQAIESMQGFEFYDKPMRITYAKNKSDAVSKLEGTFVQRPKLPKGERRRRRLAEKGIVPGVSPAPQAQAATMAPPAAAAPGYAMPAAEAAAQGQSQQPPAYYGGPPPGAPPMQFPGGAPPAGPPPGFAPQGPPPGFMPQGPPPGWQQGAGAPMGPPPGFGAPPGAAPAAQQPPKPAAPPGENPPNHILLLMNLPEQTTDAMLNALFSQFAGLREVRLIPGRHDIAFVEYMSEDQAAVAKNGLQGFLVTPTNPLKIMFAKKTGQ